VYYSTFLYVKPCKLVFLLSAVGYSFLVNKRLYDLYCVMCYFLPQDAFDDRVPDPMGNLQLQRLDRPVAGLKETDKGRGEGRVGNKWEGQLERGEVEGPLATCPD